MRDEKIYFPLCLALLAEGVLTQVHSSSYSLLRVIIDDLWNVKHLPHSSIFNFVNWSFHTDLHEYIIDDGVSDPTD